MYSLIDSDELQGVIRNPFAFLFPIQWGFSGSIQTLPSASKKERSFLFYRTVIFHSECYGYESNEGNHNRNSCNNFFVSKVGI